MKKTFKITVLLCLMVLVLLTTASCDQLLDKLFVMQGDEQVTTNPNGEKATTPPEVHTHNFGDWVTVKEPTKTEDGQKERSCSCGEKETLSVPAIGSSGLEYITYEDRTCAIMKIGTCEDVDIYIPSEIDGCKVTRIFGNAFRFCTDLKSVTIPDCVVKIGDSAFEGCTNLEKITIGKGITTLYKEMFEGCDKLIQKENGVWYVDKWVIGCDVNLPNVNLREDTIGIGMNAFQTSKANNIILPNSLMYINGSFAMSPFITSITIPDSVIGIDKEAFGACFKLVEVYNLSSVTLTKEDFPNALIDIYTSADAPSKLWTDTKGYVFYEEGQTCYLMDYTGTDTELTLPENCNGKSYVIHRNALSHRFNLTSVIIPAEVTDIGDEVFRFCTALVDITFKGTQAQWNSMIEDAADWDFRTGLGSYTVHCIDGDIVKS